MKDKTTHALYLLLIALLSGGWWWTSRPVARHARFQSDLIAHTENFGRVTWLGLPIWQSVMDLWTVQETIGEVRPALLIECGTYKGGSAVFFGQLFDLLGHGRVITVDIEKQHSLTHPRVDFRIGDCAGAEMVAAIAAEAKAAGGPVMVVLDSDHSQAHVAKELAAYAQLVTVGSYLHVQDGVIDTEPQFAQARPGPLRAIEAFLPDHPEFQLDAERSGRYLITHHPKGWLKRVR